MLNRNRSRGLETISLALCAAVLTLALPGAADAKERGDRHPNVTVGDHDRPNHRDKHRSHVARRSNARDRWFHRHDSRTSYRKARHARRDGHYDRPHAKRQHTPHYAHDVKYNKHHVKFHCRACNHTFRYQRGFYDHVHHRHHVPFWRIPFLLGYANFGWIFHG